MEIDKETTVAFSGYRPEKFPFALDEGNDEYLKLCNNIENVLLRLSEQGYRTYLCGMARGFDLLCGKILLDIVRKNENLDVELIAVLPFEQQGFSGSWGKAHKLLRAKAIFEIVIASEYSKQCFHLRNRFLIENSSCLVCYWDGQKGGTASTVQTAEKFNHTIFNIAKTQKDCHFSNSRD